MHQSFINFRHYRYGLIAGIASLITLVTYLLDRPRVPPNGGTWLGYTLGTIAALLVIFLALFGIRKRSFRSTIGTAIGWLSAHVYFGLAAVLIATLHSGMHFGRNVHTVAYVLMCLVTLSGCWGVYAYVSYPGAMMQQRGNLRRSEFLRQIAELDSSSLELAESISPQMTQLLAEGARRTDLGGGNLWKQLRSRDESTLLLGIGSAPRRSSLVSNANQRALIRTLAEIRPGRSSSEVALSSVQKLLELAGSKAVLLQRLRRETQLAALLRIWLFLHVPLCCALLAALCIHVVTVFLYW
ncbi:MAG TPA: hypothetical protein VGO18_00850 [Steroidobacteraceae bacterium]|nr:hypothetical protein [Steroidobacteraceae bacterium]